MEATNPTLARARLLCVLVAATLVIVGCTHSDSHSDRAVASYGTLTGRIVSGPASLVSGPGITASPSVPVAGADLRIFNSKGAAVATARTDGDGLYRLALPPGNYRVEHGAGFSGAARNLPTMVAISPNGQTRLDVWVDTAIRAPGGRAVTR